MFSRTLGVLALCAAVGCGFAVGQATSGASGGFDATQDEATNSVRIVRLSQVRGTVQMDRNTGRGFEEAFANIPVVAGAKLRTGEGVAEIEFEDNSSLRLAPWTVVQFSELGRTAAGSTISLVEVGRGEVYASLVKTKGNAFSLTYRGAKAVLTPGAHVRLDARTQEATLAVFEGDATLTVGSATTVLAKRETVLLNPATETVSAVAHGTDEQDFDAWDKQEADFHRQSAGLVGNGGSGLYGANDLNYYGSFVDMPGCGSMWRPYFANAAWDPFASGVWTWYPAAGYSWVSVYPWAWLPFHSGSWASCGAAGWGWRPGGSWVGLSNAKALRIAAHPLPHPVPGPPERTGSTLVPVNMDQLPVSGVDRGARFAFRQNSAGLGVPRADYGNLRSVSSRVDQRGEAMRGLAPSVFVASTPARGEAAMGRSGGTAGAGAVRVASGAGLSVTPSSTRSSSGGTSAALMTSGMASPSAMSLPNAGRSVSAPAPAAGGGASAGGHH